MSEKPECDVSSSPHRRDEDSECEYSPRPPKGREVSAACNGATSKDAQLDQSAITNGTPQLSMEKTDHKATTQKFPTRENLAGQPLYAFVVDSEKYLCPGDHVLYQSSKPPFRVMFYSALISSCQDATGRVTVITNSVIGVTKKEVYFDELQNVHKVEYDSCRYSGEESIERANRRFKLKENCYHALYNNSHFFVTWCKTGREYPLTDILVEISQDPHLNDGIISPILYKKAVKSTNELNRGDHVMLDSQHYLVDRIVDKNSTFSAYTVNMQTNRVCWHEDLPWNHTLHVITCSEHPDSIESTDAYERAGEEFKRETLWDSSDLFVTAMRCGRSHSSDLECILDHDVSVTGCSPITPEETINEGDHLLINSLKNTLHSVLVFKCLNHTQVTVCPPVDSSNVLDLTTYPEVHRVNYSSSLPAKDVLARARSKYGLKLLQQNPVSNHSLFATWAKIGKEESLPENIVKSKFTVERLLSSDHIKVGDHIVERIDSKRKHFLVCDKSREYACTYTVVFCSPGGLVCEQSVTFDCSELYRIVYLQDSVTSSEAVERARAQVGQWKHSPWDRMMFIMQAKSVDNRCQATITHITKIILAEEERVYEGDHLILKRGQNTLYSTLVVEWINCKRVVVVPPVENCEEINLSNYPEVYRIEYSGNSSMTDIKKRVLSISEIANAIFAIECISVTDQIKVGDHLVEKLEHRLRFKHYVVSSVNKKSFTIVYGQCGSISEEIVTEDDMSDKRVYRLVALQSYPSAICTMESAKKSSGKSIHWDQFLFDIFQTKSSCKKPTSKSQIISLSQLQLGDYVTVIPNKFHTQRSRHYIVADVKLPDTCSAVECYQGNVSLEDLNLKQINPDKYPKYFRFNYEPGTCHQAEKSLALALSLMDKKFTEASFVHFLKTNQESIEIETGRRVHNGRDSRIPISRNEITDFSQVRLGDYLVKEQRGAMPHHCLVTAVSSSGVCTAVELYQGKFSKFNLTTPQKEKQAKYYCMNYKPDVCVPVIDSVKMALLLVDKNFVHLLKTDEEDAEIDEDSIKLSTTVAHNYAIPQYIKPVDSVADIHGGDHIVYSVTRPPFHPIYCSALVLEVNQDGESDEISFLTLEKSGLVEKTFSFKLLVNVGKVIYQGCTSSDETTVCRGKQALRDKCEGHHDKFNNGHHFVVRLKAGKESSLTDLINIFVDSTKHGNDMPRLKPVLTKMSIKSITDINPGDHIMIKSTHHLVKCVDVDDRKVEVYSIRKKRVVCIKKAVVKKDVIKCIKYDSKTRVFDASESLRLAEDEVCRNAEWERSDMFVTTTKCGAGFIIDRRCMMPEEIHVHCTDIAENTSVDIGDHLLIRDEETGKLCSVLVYRFYHQTKIEVLPSLSQTYEHQIIDLTQYEEKYRVNYTHSLPSTEVNMRAVSQTGHELLSQCSDDCFTYIHWAKTGGESSISPEKLVQDPRRLALIRPTTYCKILSPYEIQVGDHLFWDKDATKSHRIHVLVSECSVDENPLMFRVIYYSKGRFHENVKCFTKSMGKHIYKINYPEALPADIALKRARSKVSKHDLSPFTRMWFVPWAKTGSQKGLEVGFLKNSTRPVTKSRISCFTQLNPGDYLVKEPERNYYHHYIVLSVDSPIECTVAESWMKKIREVPLKWENISDQNQRPWFYRVNYEDGMCIPSNDSIKQARSQIGKIHLSPLSEYLREKFVHHLKTGEAAVIDTDELLDDRILLQRERVTSAMELKCGDHIERPLSFKMLRDHAQHHMLVVEPIDDEHCKVIHYKVCPSISKVLKFKKGDRICEVVNIFAVDNVHLIRYPERINPQAGMKTLLDLCEVEEKTVLKNLTGMEEYHIKDNNCEHLIMLATVGFPLSIQVHYAILKALQFSKTFAKNAGEMVLHHASSYRCGEVPLHHVCSQHVIQKAQMIHQASCSNSAVHVAASKTGVATAKAGVKAAAKGSVKSATKSTLKAASKASSKSAAKATVKTASKATFHAGSEAAVRATLLGTIGGIAFGINVLLETPFYIRGAYKLHRQKQFDVISEEEYKRQMIAMSLKSASTVIGGTAGAIAGQAAIPVPVVGAVVGGFVGGVCGQVGGHIEGLAVKRAIKDPIQVTLPILRRLKYVKIVDGEILEEKYDKSEDAVLDEEDDEEENDDESDQPSSQ